MSVSARFYVTTITRQSYNPEHAEVKLKPALQGEGNKAWSTATPSGDITLQVNNPPAATWFAERLGKDIAITFEDVPGD